MVAAAAAYSTMGDLSLLERMTVQPKTEALYEDAMTPFLSSATSAAAGSSRMPKWTKILRGTSTSGSAAANQPTMARCAWRR